MPGLSPTCDALLVLETPALVLDGEALTSNIDRMATMARQSGVGLRPHSKTHKSKDIAALQLNAGAIGICCATVIEAEALSAANISGLLITSPFMGAEKFARAAKLNRANGLMIVVDHPAQVEGLLAALRPGEPRLRVLIDVDVGQTRTGICDLAGGVELAKMIAQAPPFEFAGIQGYAGHAQHIVEPAERRAAGLQSASTLRSFAQMITNNGLPPRIITGSGTGTHKLDCNGPYNELQVGSYLFMDSEYAGLKGDDGPGLVFAPSLFVLATVTSVNRPGQVTVDAGTKALATNGPAPCHIIGVPSGAAYKFAGDEHGIITFPAGAKAPSIGSRMLIGATHCDPTVNLHATFHVLMDGELKRWPVGGRYDS